MNSAVTDRQRQLKQLVEAHDRLQRQLQRPTGGDGYELRHSPTSGISAMPSADFDIVPLSKKVPHFQPSVKVQEPVQQGSPVKKAHKSPTSNKTHANSMQTSNFKKTEEVERLRREVETMSEVCKSLEHALAQSSDSPTSSTEVLGKWRVQVFKSLLQSRLAQDTISSQTTQIASLSVAVSSLRADLEASNRRCDKMQSNIDKLQSSNKQLQQLNEEYRSVVGQIVLADQERHEDADRQLMLERQRMENAVHKLVSDYSHDMEQKIGRFTIGMRERFEKIQKRMWYMSDRLNMATQLIQQQQQTTIQNNTGEDVDVLKRMISDRDRVIAVLSSKLNQAARQQQLLINQNQALQLKTAEQNYASNNISSHQPHNFDSFDSISHLLQTNNPVHLNPVQLNSNNSQSSSVNIPQHQQPVPIFEQPVDQSNVGNELTGDSRQELVKSLHQLQKLQELSRELLM